MLPGWCDLAVEPGRVPRGRPVRDRHRAVPGRGARRAAPDDGQRPAPGGRRRLPRRPRRRPRRPAGRLTGLRVFAGYAGWSPGQLAGEIAEGAWACVPGRPDDVLSDAGRARICGARSWAARPAGWPCSPPHPPIRRRTEPVARREARPPDLVGSPGRGRSGEEAALSCCLGPVPTAPVGRAARPRIPGGPSEPQRRRDLRMVGRLRGLLLGRQVHRARGPWSDSVTVDVERRPSASGVDELHQQVVGGRDGDGRARPAGRTARSAGCRSSAAPASV